MDATLPTDKEMRLLNAKRYCQLVGDRAGYAANAIETRINWHPSSSTERS